MDPITAAISFKYQLCINVFNQVLKETQIINDFKLFDKHDQSHHLPQLEVRRSKCLNHINVKFKTHCRYE